LPIHGEAGISLWQNMRAEVKEPEVILEMSVKLPVAGLSFSRQIKIRRGESVAYFKEEVVNEKRADHFFHWTQHATLGPAFLSHWVASPLARFASDNNFERIPESPPDRVPSAVCARRIRFLSRDWLLSRLYEVGRGEPPRHRLTRFWHFVHVLPAITATFP
jgi:hypothetical protein